MSAEVGGSLLPDNAWRPGQAAVEAFLVERFGPSVHSVATLRQGAWSAAYAFHHGGQALVARFSPFDEDFAKDRRVANHRMPGLPVPRILEIGTAFGGYYAISERVYGVYLDELDSRQVRAVLPSLWGVLDALRELDLPDTSGFGQWGSDGRAPHPSWSAALLDVQNDLPNRRTAGWRARLEASPLGGGPFEEAFAALQSLVSACPDVRHLVHSDLLNYNVLVQDNRLAAVIDWGSALFGDFLYDIAWFCFWSPWYPAWGGIDFQAEAAAHYASLGIDVPLLEARLRCYQLHIGLDSQAYNAFRGRWAALEASTRRTLAIARAA